MRSDRIGDVSDAYGVEVFAIASLLDEYLAIHIVIVACSEYLNISHHLQNIQSLFYCSIEVNGPQLSPMQTYT